MRPFHSVPIQHPLSKSCEGFHLTVETKCNERDDADGERRNDMCIIPTSIIQTTCCMPHIDEALWDNGIALSIWTRFRDEDIPGVGSPRPIQGENDQSGAAAEQYTSDRVHSLDNINKRSYIVKSVG